MFDASNTHRNLTVEAWLYVSRPMWVPHSCPWGSTIELLHDLPSATLAPSGSTPPCTRSWVSQTGVMGAVGTWWIEIVVHDVDGRPTPSAPVPTPPGRKTRTVRCHHHKPFELHVVEVCGSIVQHLQLLNHSFERKTILTRTIGSVGLQHTVRKDILVVEECR